MQVVNIAVADKNRNWIGVGWGGGGNEEGALHCSKLRDNYKHTCRLSHLCLERMKYFFDCIVLLKMYIRNMEQSVLDLLMVGNDFFKPNIWLIQ